MEAPVGPEALREQGVPAAIPKHTQAIAARADVVIDVETPEHWIPLPPTLRSSCIGRPRERSATVKHANASHARIWLLPAAAMPRGLLLEISNDGTGFDPSLSWPGHLGLKTMQQRVERLGGNLAVRSTRACGTTIQSLVLVCTAARPGSPRLEGRT